MIPHPINMAWVKALGANPTPPLRKKVIDHAANDAAVFQRTDSRPAVAPNLDRLEKNGVTGTQFP